MIKLLIRLSLVLLVSYQFPTPCTAMKNYGAPGIPGMPGSRGYERAYGGYEGAPARSNTYSNSASGLPSQPARRGLGISAWGIIILVVAIILAGVGCYYFSICYPTVCMNSRSKYNIMGLPPTMV